jgi:putative transposase
LRVKARYFEVGRSPITKRKRFTEEQITFALRQAENGVPVVENCRKMEVREATFYRWKKKFAGMGVAELRSLKQLEEENRKLKQLVADLSLDKHMLQDIWYQNGEHPNKPKYSHPNWANY